MKLDYCKKMYLVARGIEAAALISVMGLTANFIAQTNSAGHQAPPILLAVVIFAVLSFFWMIIGLSQYEDTHIPYLVTGSIDLAFTLIFAVFAILLGQPTSTSLANCYSLSNGTDGTITAFPVLGVNTTVGNATVPGGSDDTTAAATLSPLLNGTDARYLQLENVSAQTACLELRADWGLIIALTAAFAFSGAFAIIMWSGKWRAMGGGSHSSSPNAGRFGGACKDWPQPEKDID